MAENTNPPTDIDCSSRKRPRLGLSHGETTTAGESMIHNPINPEPSKVVHIRHLNPDAIEADLIVSMSLFGPVAYAICVPEKRMALVEFEDQDSATKCVQHANAVQRRLALPIRVAGHQVAVNYSLSKYVQRSVLESERPNKVLVLTISNQREQPITVDVIHQICSPHGIIYRIAKVKWTRLVQVLVEFKSIEAARRAKHAINGADIYTGCCTIKVEFARVDRVNVSKSDRDNGDSMDYTVNEEKVHRSCPSPSEEEEGRSQSVASSSGEPSSNNKRSGHRRWYTDIDIAASDPHDRGRFGRAPLIHRPRSDEGSSRFDYGGLTFRLHEREGWEGTQLQQQVQPEAGNSRRWTEQLPATNVVAGSTSWRSWRPQPTLISATSSVESGVATTAGQRAVAAVDPAVAEKKTSMIWIGGHHGYRGEDSWVKRWHNYEGQ